MHANLVGAGAILDVIFHLHSVSLGSSVLHNETLLQWQVENKINCKQHELEYFTDGINFDAKQHLSKGLYHLQITQKNGESGFYPFLIQ